MYVCRLATSTCVCMGVTSAAAMAPGAESMYPRVCRVMKCMRIGVELAKAASSATRAHLRPARSSHR